MGPGILLIAVALQHLLNPLHIAPTNPLFAKICGASIESHMRLIAFLIERSIDHVIVIASIQAPMLRMLNGGLGA